MSADPLVELHALFDEARQVPTLPRRRGSRGEADPMEELEATLERAKRSATEPLALLELVEAAAGAGASAPLELGGPTPVDALLESPPPAPAVSSLSPQPPGPAPGAEAPGQGHEALLGRELVALLAERALAGEARAAAITLAAQALESGDRETIRALLRILITGEVSTS